ncbi:uncharacterized protein LOC142319096 isoform X2 [Lycorma delicatula]|uniref:uncharacterized protein LOC142319096 isoform X2 n=1 Tax=Lycorma delicatula TaxID=130591 RepID=UPI003F51850D
MPSIFNHDNNACWGIRRTSFNIFNEPTNFDVTSQKNVCSNTTVCPEVNRVNNFHGSSNGYYGYHLQTNVENNDDNCAMDTSNGFTSEVATNRLELNRNGFSVSGVRPQNNVGDEFWRRKRSYSGDLQDSNKRSRKEEPESFVTMADAEVEEQNSSTNTESCDSDLPVYSLFRCTMSHYMCFG